VDVLYAFVGGRNVGGRLDFQLGRQIHFDLVDFFAYDGGDAVVRVRRGLAVEAFAGTEVRGDLPLASPIYELDGLGRCASLTGGSGRPPSIRCPVSRPPA
jgi:hypothetical protein